MGRDEAVLRAVGAGEQPPTLRLYGWQPPCLSLGYGQRSADVDFARATALGWEVVRRPTGGRAILHTDELTYSVTLPAGHPLAAGSVIESYRRISAALLNALQRLGAQAVADRQTAAQEAGAVCFETPSHYEVTVGGRKLIGSAQVRRFGGVLQHGSLPLTGDIARICDGLTFRDEAERAAAQARVRQRAAALADVLPVGTSDTVDLWRRAATAFVEAFSATFALTLAEGALSNAEATGAAELAATRYANPAWTRRR